jgi:hypothetical protein
MRHWIPTFPLAAGVAFQLVSWIVLLWFAFVPGMPLPLVWVHAVALGWLTTVALAVLIFVIPQFTELRWRNEALARTCAAALPLGTALFLYAWLTRNDVLLSVAAAAVAATIVTYVVVALATLAQRAPGRTEAAIARALTVALSMLGITALLGFALAEFGLRGNAAVFVVLLSHGVLGTVAWLTVLVSGVSVQTLRPMLGARSRWPRAHVVSGAAFLLGAVVAAAGAPWSVAMLRAGISIGAAGAAVYSADVLDVVRRATPHPPVRAFVIASIAWLLVASVCAVGAAWRYDAGAAPWGWVAVFTGLAGWLGGMVNAHLHHLGVRVLTTLLRGDDDETRPWDVVNQPLAWLTFGLAQLAVAGTVLALPLAIPRLQPVAALAGIASVLCMLANMLLVRRSLQRAPVTLV